MTMRTTGPARRGLGALLVAGLVATVVGTGTAPSAGAAGALPPDPPANITLPAAPAACGETWTSTFCEVSLVQQLDQARASMGLAPYALPDTFYDSPAAQQVLDLTNSDRVAYGLAPIDGVSDALSQASAPGAAGGKDPDGVAVNGVQPQGWASNWAGGMPSMLVAYYLWMYDDGAGSGNIDCTAPTDSGCWGHRHNLLHPGFGPGSALGYAAAASSFGPAHAMLIEQFAPGSPIALSSTWAADSARPQSTGVPPGPVVRQAGSDRIDTAVRVSQGSFGGSGAQAAVLALADNFPDALAGGPLAAAKRGPVLLTHGDALDGRVATELKRVLAPGATVYVLGGTAALPEAVAGAVTGLGFTATRLAGDTRAGTAVAIAGALGNPDLVFETSGANFPDALSAVPAAIAQGGAILLTAGSTQDPATAAWIAAHPPRGRYAVGGPAAAADANAAPVSGADRYATSTAVARRFFPNALVAGIASGTAFPDALSGGPAIAALGGPMLLTDPGTVPAPLTSWLREVAARLRTAYVYGGTQAVGDPVAATIVRQG